jgi:hypothetical protein
MAAAPDADPLVAVLDQLAACRERLDTLDEQVAALLHLLPGSPKEEAKDGYQPRPAPTWWKLAPGDRQAPLTRLHDWTEHIYRPGYGHLSASLASCWPQHDLCLYALDIASQLWCFLYLQPERTYRLLTAQAEFQVRILPALADQLTAETTRCGHHPVPGYGARRD